jgi:hypothetical protein
MIKRVAISGLVVMTLAFFLHGAVEPKEVRVRAVDYPGSYKPDGMWSGLYVASNGKVYSGLCTHGGSALFYEYDATSSVNRLVAEIGRILGDNGTGERSHSKIHTRFAEDSRGNIYFATGNQGGGPRQIDPLTWTEKGSHIFRYNPSKGELELLGVIAPNWGSYGLVLDKKRDIAYLTCLDNHLYSFDIKTRTSRDLGRVNNWDVNRMIAMDDRGNVYGTFIDHYLWKYDVDSDQLLDLPLQIPFERDLKFTYHGGRPAMDRRYNWRYAEWVASLGKIYGMECGRSLLFEYDPHLGKHGKVRLVADMALDSQIESGEHPYAPLAVGFSSDGIVYYAIVDRVFDYSATEQATVARSSTFLQTCDLRTGQKQMLGRLVTTTGLRVLGSGACEVASDGTVYLCAAVEEPDLDRSAGRAAGVEPFRLQLLVLDPRN